ncbi:homoserine kinase [Streptosporangium roseum]|uniref:Homoserine kinase n=1 Tax=Streptosporangium roseum (strain ATCC 12428 / DSM 43021 / JCM 3005 / KCTC 9067 / NCIMB 10171 / NRRL 2505 / NI 9100) TaxID=479432 RepID=D2ARW2_STRRD|nr:homoserine kinase [Streptosporangium roseum]ACZ84641.1 Homoserine kinase [Streptosporangium roseum DSM 43021]
MTDSIKVTVRVPATSANLGPGFDTLGLALALYDEVEVGLVDPGGDPRSRSVSIEVTGEGAGELDDGEGHLIVKTIRLTFDRMGLPQPRGIRLRCLNRIPHARGLGSSSAAICAGILAARALAGAPYPVVDGPDPAGGRDGAGPGRPAARPEFTDDDVFALATEIEGHPDNVAPCLAGGLTIAWTDQSDAPHMVKLVPHADIRPVAIIPRHRLSTEVARGLLPKDVPHSDASANAGRAALLIAALTERPERELLLAATEDRLHQNYRAPAMPQSADLVQRLRGIGVPTVVSGAGPTILAFSTVDTQDLIAPEVGTDWHIQPLDVETRGACVVSPETR